MSQNSASPAWLQRLKSINPYSAAFANEFAVWLVKEGIIEKHIADRATAAATRSGDRLDIALINTGLISEQTLVTALAGFLELRRWNPESQSAEALFPTTLPAHFVLNNRLLPVKSDGNWIEIAAVDPFDLLPIVSASQALAAPLQLSIIGATDFENISKALYKEHATVPGQRDEYEAGAGEESDLQRLRDSASGGPIIQIVNDIIAKAVEARASDIHIESVIDGIQVRYRIDGALRPSTLLPIRLRAAVISRIKILAKLDIAERRLPLDGRMKLAFHGNDIDFRVATIPTVHGESAVVRILDRSRVTLNLDALGFADDHQNALRKLITEPNGMIIVTGPTGSGKTTTLYTLLDQVNRADIKIFTVEDPVEYILDGINQVQVHPEIGLDFPACLRSILRHNPNMIMIGEIRDKETAAIAVQASLTGHLVFCTLHTNNAPSTIGRLVDMGAEHFLLGTVIKGIVAQRLVRRLCEACARPHRNAQLIADGLRMRNPMMSDWHAPNLKEPTGCPECNNTGYKGRSTIVELILVDEAIQRAILARKDAVELMQIAREAGMRTMLEDGYLKAWIGLVAVEDVIAATESSFEVALSTN